jgi:hypothetical protein
MVEVLIDFLVIFVLVCLFYLLVLNRSKKDFNKLKPNDFIRMFVLKYNIDIEKINYNLMINLIAVINSFIIAITSAIIIKIEGFIWSLIACFVILFILVFVLFDMAGKYIKKTEKKVKKAKVSKKKKIKKKEDEK